MVYLWIVCASVKFYTIEFQIIWKFLIQMNCRKLPHCKLLHISSVHSHVHVSTTWELYNPLLLGLILFLLTCIINRFRLEIMAINCIHLQVFIASSCVHIPTLSFYLNVIYTATILLPLHLWNVYASVCCCSDTAL